MLHVRAGTRVGSQGVFPGDLPNPGIKPTSPALAGRFFTTEIGRASCRERVCEAV